MLPFSLSLRPGEPVVEQTVYAVTRAIVSGQLGPGDRFPSVRTPEEEATVKRLYPDQARFRAEEQELSTRRSRGRQIGSRAPGFRPSAFGFRLSALGFRLSALGSRAQACYLGGSDA